MSNHTHTHPREADAPVLADVLTGWHYASPSTLLPVFAAPWRGLAGTEQEADPGRVFARPTSRHRRAFSFLIRAGRMDADALDRRPHRADTTGPDGSSWEIDVQADRWTGSQFEHLAWETRSALRDVLAASLAAFLDGPPARLAALTAELVDAERTYEAARHAVADTRRAYIEAEEAASAAADRLADARAAVTLADAGPDACPGCGRPASPPPGYPYGPCERCPEQVTP